MRYDKVLSFQRHCINKIKQNNRYQCAELRAAILYEDDIWRTLGFTVRMLDKQVDVSKLNIIEKDSEIEGIIFLRGFISINKVIEIIESLKDGKIPIGEYIIHCNCDGWARLDLKTAQDPKMILLDWPYDKFEFQIEAKGENSPIGEFIHYKTYKSFQDKFEELSLPYKYASEMIYEKVGISDSHVISCQFFLPTYDAKMEDYKLTNQILWIKLKLHGHKDNLEGLKISIHLSRQDLPNKQIDIEQPILENSIPIPYWPEGMHIVLGRDGLKIDEIKYDLQNDNEKIVYLYNEDWEALKNELEELKKKYHDIKGIPVNVFISHSTKDIDIIRPINESLQRLGLSTFLSEDIKLEGSFLKKVEEHLQGCKVFLVILTEESIISQFVQQEIGYAISLNKKIVTILFPEIRQKGFITIYDPIDHEGDLNQTIFRLFLFFKNNFSDMFDLTKLHLRCSKCSKNRILEVPSEEDIARSVASEKPIIKMCSNCFKQITIDPYTFSVD